MVNKIVSIECINTIICDECVGAVLHQLRMLEVIEKTLPNTSFGLDVSHIRSRSPDSTKGATLIGNKMTLMLLFERRFCTYMHPIQSGILN